MKNITSILGTAIFVSVASPSIAQTTENEKTLRTESSVAADTTLGWKKGGFIGISLSQTGLTNWAAGGQNSVALNGLFSLFLHKKMQSALWENYLDLGYGILKQGTSSNWRKTDDKIDCTSKYGKKASKNWYYAGLANFKTQWDIGYNYPNDSIIISNFLAPAYLIGALGMDYKPNSNFSLFIAPLTLKATFVNDRRLADAGAFGVDKAVVNAAGAITTPGKNIRAEFGGYLRMMYKTEVMHNVGFLTKLDLFSNYMHNPQNVDVNWEILLSMKVNKYISATIATQLVYDDDINISVYNKNNILEAVGPRTQFKEVINVGFSYKF